MNMDGLDYRPWYFNYRQARSTSRIIYWGKKYNGIRILLHDINNKDGKGETSLFFTPKDFFTPMPLHIFLEHVAEIKSLNDLTDEGKEAIRKILEYYMKEF